jgi:hypothetical protein
MLTLQKQGSSTGEQAAQRQVSAAAQQSSSKSRTQLQVLLPYCAASAA